MYVRLAAGLAGMVLAVTPAAAEETFSCTDGKVVGLIWDKENPRPSGRIMTFNKKRRNMKIISETRREMVPPSGDGKGTKSVLTCSKRYHKIQKRTFLMCTGRGSAWFFSGNNYTRAYLYGPYQGGNNNITVAHGTCAKLSPGAAPTGP